MIASVGHRVRRRGTCLLAGLLIIVAAVAACGAGEARPAIGGATLVATTAGSGSAGTICRGISGPGVAAQQQANVVREPLAATFVPVTGVRCDVTNEQTADQGEWLVLVETRATQNLGSLAAVLRQPDQTASAAGGSCTLELDTDPEVWLLDATGTAVLPRWPRDSCSHLLPEALKALGALSWHETARVRIRQLTPRAASDSGCAAAWKYLVGTAVKYGVSPAPGTFTALRNPKGLRLCVYRRSASDALAGEFTSGRQIPPSGWEALLAGLDAATPMTASCKREATQFAVLHGGTRAFAEIELDGCQRILTPDNGLRQATPQLIALLA